MKQPTLEQRVAALEKHVMQLLVQRPPDADKEHLLARPTLEQRVAALEKHVVQLLAMLPPSPQRLDWRSTVGMFADDPVMREIQEAGQRIRDEDRRRTRKQLDAADRKLGKAKGQRTLR
jgi:hypothetical protein